MRPRAVGFGMNRSPKIGPAGNSISYRCCTLISFELSKASFFLGKCPVVEVGPMGLKKVAIIGAGASGLAQVKQLVDTFGRPKVEDELEVVVFESREEVGGVW